jgi:hypothetical protein
MPSATSADFTSHLLIFGLFKDDTSIMGHERGQDENTLVHVVHKTETVLRV